MKRQSIRDVQHLARKRSNDKMGQVRDDLFRIQMDQRRVWVDFNGDTVVALPNGKQARVAKSRGLTLMAGSISPTSLERTSNDPRGK